MSFFATTISGTPAQTKNNDGRRFSGKSPAWLFHLRPKCVCSLMNSMAFRYIKGTGHEHGQTIRIFWTLSAFHVFSLLVINLATLIIGSWLRGFP